MLSTRRILVVIGAFIAIPLLIWAYSLFAPQPSNTTPPSNIPTASRRSDDELMSALQKRYPALSQEKASVLSSQRVLPQWYVLTLKEPSLSYNTTYALFDDRPRNDRIIVYEQGRAYPDTPAMSQLPRVVEEKMNSEGE